MKNPTRLAISLLLAMALAPVQANTVEDSANDCVSDVERLFNASQSSAAEDEGTCDQMIECANEAIGPSDNEHPQSADAIGTQCKPEVGPVDKCDYVEDVPGQCDTPGLCEDPRYEDVCALNYCAYVPDGVPTVCGHPGLGDPCDYVPEVVPGLCGRDPPPIEELDPCEFVPSLPDCNQGPPPVQAHAAATPTIGFSPTPGTGQYTCTGSKTTVATGTVGGSVGGGLLVPAEVSASVDIHLIQYDFACDYSMWATGSGYGHVNRRVQNALQKGGATPVPLGDACTYDGPIVPSCSPPPFAVLTDTFTGAGLTGPGFPLPTQVSICPPDQELAMFTFNDALEGVSLGQVRDGAAWTCTNYGIHYV